MATGTSIVYRPEKYEGEVGSRHIDVVLPAIASLALDAGADRLATDYERTPDDFNNSLEGLRNWGEAAARVLPAGVDLALDVDESGNTSRAYEPSLYTLWAESDEITGVYLRFAEARTALHGVSMLRTPIMGRGIAIEATTNPDSRDIRHAHTMYIVEAKREHDARYTWATPRPARLFDMSEFSTKPYMAGPLYNGHPNEVTSDVRQSQVVELGHNLFEKLLA